MMYPVLSIFSKILDTEKEKILNDILATIHEFLCGIVSNLFSHLSNTSEQFFSLKETQCVLLFFQKFAICLFVIGCLFAVLDMGLHSEKGVAPQLKSFSVTLLIGGFSLSLYRILPTRLYAFVCQLCRRLMTDIGGVRQLGRTPEEELLNQIQSGNPIEGFSSSFFFFILLFYALVVIFLQNLKRNGILFTEMCVGSLYFFSLARGNTNSFFSWAKQIVALSFTAFMQNMLLYLGIFLSVKTPILGIGLLLSAKEVPRIASHFGLDTSVKGNLHQTLRTTSLAVRTTKALLL